MWPGCTAGKFVRAEGTHKEEQRRSLQQLWLRHWSLVVVLTDTAHDIRPFLRGNNLFHLLWARTLLCAEERRILLSTCSSARVSDRASQEAQQSGSTLVRARPMPVGSGRFRDHAQDSSRVLGMSFPPPLLAMKRVVWHTLTGDHDGEEDALLAQLRLPLATRSKRISHDKSILFPAPHSLPCAPVEGMDVPSSQYRGSTFTGINREILTASSQSFHHCCCTSATAIRRAVPALEP